ncbi:hypothetical protein IAG44_21790 [Streptomyces roseirectus]|uniref:Uncharacterized protein n=1 Tax=Streptomyces roseirectus TaxID=2768066 RepID=A0A7H0ISX6_9ACTN|nr:hypothetical protein IAG44_21790 [Streptomyces roseirectus]
MTAGAVLLAGIGLPGTAYAAGPTVMEARSHSTDWSVVDVRLNFGGEIEKVKASLRPVGSAEGDAPVATVTEFKETYWVSQWEGVWSSPPVHLETLGDYTIDVEATNSAGETTVKKNAGTLHYAKQPVFTDFTATPSAPTIEDKRVTVSGGMVVRDPRSRETVPFPDASVDVKSGQGTFTLVTDEAGRFSRTSEVPGDTWFWATYQGDLGYADAPSVNVDPQQAPTRIILDRNSFHPVANQSYTVTGKAEYQSGTTWKPLAGVPVEMDYKDSSVSHPSEATTDPNGRFVFSQYGYATAVYQVRFPYYPRNPWIQQTATADVRVAVTSTSRFTEFTARIDEYARLEMSGILRPVGNHFDGPVDVAVQYSPNGKTGWRTQKTVRTSFDSQFWVKDLPGYTDGYWRLSYAGSTAKDIRGTTSAVLRRNRVDTRIANADASPEPVRKGRTITVRGVLQERAPGAAWKAYGSRKVQILFRPQGKKTWYLMATVTSNRTNGSFSKGFRAQQDGTWVPVFLEPDYRHFVGAGTEDYVDVR